MGQFAQSQSMHVEQEVHDDELNEDFEDELDEELTPKELEATVKSFEEPKGLENSDVAPIANGPQNFNLNSAKIKEFQNRMQGMKPEDRKAMNELMQILGQNKNINLNPNNQNDFSHTNESHRLDSITRLHTILAHKQNGRKTKISKDVDFVQKRIQNKKNRKRGKAKKSQNNESNEQEATKKESNEMEEQYPQLLSEILNKANKSTSNALAPSANKNNQNSATPVENVQNTNAETKTAEVDENKSEISERKRKKKLRERQKEKEKKKIKKQTETTVDIDRRSKNDAILSKEENL